MPSPKLVNKDNSHTFLGSSNQGILVGCGGPAIMPNGSCAGIVSAKGVVGQKGGDGFGFSKEAKNLITKGISTATSYKNTHVQPQHKEGAGIAKQSGGAHNPLAPSASDFYNQSTNPSYGYKSGADNLKFAGSGYPEISSNTGIQSCKAGGAKKRRRKSRKMRKSRKSRKSRKMRKSRKHRRSKHTKKHKKRHHSKSKKHRRTRRKMRGGYSQFQSNVPLTKTMQLPNGSMGGSWTGQLATPPTYKILNNCHDNYNHYKQGKHYK